MRKTCSHLILAQTHLFVFCFCFCCFFIVFCFVMGERADPGQNQRPGQTCAIGVITPNQIPLTTIVTYLQKKLQKQNFKPWGQYTCMQCGTSQLQTVQENILSHIILATYRTFTVSKYLHKSPLSITAFVTFTSYKFDGAPRTLTWQSLDLVQCHL